MTNKRQRDMQRNFAVMDELFNQMVFIPSLKRNGFLPEDWDGSTDSPEFLSARQKQIEKNRREENGGAE